MVRTLLDRPDPNRRTARTTEPKDGTQTVTEKTTPKPTPQTRANRLRGLELAVQNYAGRAVPSERILATADEFADYLHTGARP